MNAGYINLKHGMDYYEVKLYEKCIKRWTSVTNPLPYPQAKDRWKKLTKNGTSFAKKHHGDYFKLFKVKDNINLIITDYKK